ncbi:MAG: phosphate ABC transporter ATP-binding protein, partial [Panacagrimonas sp.]
MTGVQDRTPITHGIDIEAMQRERSGVNLEDETIALEVDNLDLYYGDKKALKSVTMKIPQKKVTAFIGPSGCGKSTLLRCFNRMNDLIDGCRTEGAIKLYGNNIFDKGVDAAQLRRRIGMVFQKPNPFPKSIYENVAYGLRLAGVSKKRLLDETVEWALKGAALWDEVKD